MPDNIQDSFQVNQYDKIIRENLEVTLPVIVRELLGLDIAESEEIPDDIQHTKERKPDALKKVKDSSGNKYVLHVEFQVPNEKEMVYRMAEYSIMLMRRYQLPVKQFVIFLKAGKPTMATAIDAKNLKYHYRLVRISEVSYQLFLKSKNPEVKMLGILADLGTENSYNAVEAIVNEIRTSDSSELTKEKYFKQLRIFAQLRSNVEPQLLKIMQSVNTFFKVEKDVFYKLGERKGVEKGAEKARQIMVENLLTKRGFTDQEAAEIAEVPVDYIREIRSGLSMNK